jgi:aspartate carbamoyltransferase catalytic subunit
LRVPDYVKSDIDRGCGSVYREAERMQDVLSELDILYMTRVQKERFFNEDDYIRLKDSYILDAEKMSLAPRDMIVMHPLPRVNEIATEVDADSRAVYFKQVENGMYARMALILALLGKS